MKIELIQKIMAICPELNDKGLSRDTVANLRVFLEALEKS